MTTAVRAAEPVAEVRTERRSTFRPDIQGLRAIAVGSVVLYHDGLHVFSGGYVGVDVFFVISGFLITSHLLRDVLGPDRLSFGAFYARRARRILPASFAVNVLTLLAAVALIPPTEVHQAVRDSIATALYVPNVIFANRATDYLAQSAAPSLYQHYWSLGVEEQFYLVWPLLLVVAFAVGGRRRAWLGGVLVVVAVASFVTCVRLTSTNEPQAFFMLPSRAWEFAVGGLTALALAKGWRLPRALGELAGWLGLVGLAVAIFGFDAQTRFPGSAAALPVLAAALVILGGASGHTVPGRFLSVRPMVFVGEISYSLYLVHWPVFTIAAVRAAAADGRPLSLSYRLVLLLLCIPLAYLLYRFVENPVRRSRRISVLRPRWTLTGALAVSGAVVLVAAVCSAFASATALRSDRSASAPTLGVSPAGTPYVPSNLQPSLTNVSNDNPASYSDGCHLSVTYTALPSGCTFGTNPAAPLVVLFGDSHAAQWFPALDTLAEQGKIRLESDTKSGCPSADIDVDYQSNTGPQPYPQCPVWRQNVLKRLADSPPAMVLLSNYNQATLPAGGTPSPHAWADAIKSTLAQLPARTKGVVLGETPLPGLTPADCLALHLNDAGSCAPAVGDALNSAMLSAERAATDGAHGHYVDLSSHLCNASTCPLIIGNLLVYRDSQHLTATFSKALAPLLWAQLQQLL